MLFYIIGISLLFLTTNALRLQLIDCPKNCSCSQGDDKIILTLEDPNTVARLTIDCQNRTIDDNYTTAETLSEEINNMLAGLENLSFLTITNSLLEEVPMEICNKARLEELHLDGNNLECLPANCFDRLSNLQILTANNNHITSLQDDLITGLQHLRMLSFVHNNINHIGLHVFSNSSDLTSLSSIDLSYNQLRTLDIWPFTRAQVVNNFVLNVDSNKIQNLSNALGISFNCFSNPIQHLTISMRSNLIAHFFDLLDAFNFSQIIDIGCVFGKPQQFSFDAKWNPIVCDCLDYKLYSICRFFQHGCTFTQNMYCTEPVQLYQSKLTNVPLEDLICTVNFGCPNNCTCYNQPSNTLFHIFCPASGLTKLPEGIPSMNTPISILLPRAKLYNLNFSQNSIGVLEDRPYFKTTLSVDFSNSRIHTITVQALIGLQSVETILLHNNLLTSLPQDIATLNLSFSLLSIYNNLLSCNCEQVWLQRWLLSVRERLNNPNGILCTSPERLNGKNLLLIDETEFCTDPNVQIQRNVIVGFVAGMILLCILITTSVLILKKFRYELFNGTDIHIFDRDECEGENKQFDVFVSYANEDKELAHEVINFLTKHSCRVCFHEEHFLFGTSIPQNISRAVHISKRVLCLVSPHFINSGFCLTEFKEAHELGKSVRLIVMMLHQFPFISDDQGHESEINLLEKFTKTHTRIDWQEDTWKRRVEYAMPIGRMGPEEEPIIELAVEPGNQPLVRC